MKKLRSLFLLCLLSSNLAHAYIGFGVCNYGKENVPSVVCVGPTVLKETTVSGDVKVAGSLKALNVSMGSMMITGSTDIQNVKVNGFADVTGNLTADGAEFKQGLSVSASKILLSHSKIDGELIVNSQTTKPYLKMQCGSIVTGTVTFEGMEGVVQITDDSVVQGKIVNGSIEFIKHAC